MADDKKLHAACGMAICLVVGLYNIYCGLSAAVLAGLLKEIYDYTHPAEHTCDVWDFVATSAGGLVAFACLLSLRG